MVTAGGAAGKQEGMFRARHGHSRPRGSLDQGRRPQSRRGHPPGPVAGGAVGQPRGGSIARVDYVPEPVGRREPAAFDVMFAATHGAALPAPRAGATAGLRAELREKVMAAQAAEPDWATLAVDGPRETTGALGRTWHEWRATVSPR